MIEAALGIITGPLGLLLTGIVTVLVAWLGGKRKGAQDATQKREAQDAQDYQDTRGRIDDALRRDYDADYREWLRERGRKR